MGSSFGTDAGTVLPASAPETEIEGETHGGGAGIQRLRSPEDEVDAGGDGSNPGAHIPAGISPLDIARRNNNGQIVGLLESHLAKKAAEKEIRHRERREAGCMDSDTDGEDFQDKELVRKYREKHGISDPVVPDAAQSSGGNGS